MTKNEFKTIRHRLDRTQKDLAALLGVSQKTIESYEQGLRRIPANIERILYYLLFKVHLPEEQKRSRCWDVLDCPPQYRDNCLAWITAEGLYCWFVTGRSCRRGEERSGRGGDDCFTCEFFTGLREKILL